MVQGFPLRREFEDQVTVIDPSRHPEPAGDGYPRTRYVGHLVSTVDMRFRC
jgi:hypothetical protein